MPSTIRDARIAAIYEGTNGIQAADLVGRKLGMRSGGVVADLLDEFEGRAEQLQAVDGLATFGARLVDAVAITRAATTILLERSRLRPQVGARRIGGVSTHARHHGLRRIAGEVCLDRKRPR